MATAREQPDTVEVQPDNPLSGWAWLKTKGYFKLPLDCHEDAEGVILWHEDTGSWKKAVGEGLWEEALGATPPDDNDSLPSEKHSWSGSWHKAGWSRGSNENESEFKKRDGDVPEWDGKSEHRTTYFRRIDLWAATTGVRPKDRGCRLLQKLKGEAFEKLENVDPQSLKVEDSIDVYKARIVEVYEPIEDYRVGKIMDAFFDDFSRKNGQEIVDYNLAWARELQKAEKVAGEITGKWKAHLYMKKMRLSDFQKTQVLTGALGVYTVEALSKSALTAFPSMREKGGFKGDRKDRPAWKSDRGKNERKGRKPFFNRQKKGYRAHETNQDDDGPGSDEQSDSDEEEESPDENESEGESSEGEKSNAIEGDKVDDEELPKELQDMLLEAETFMTRARKQRSDVEKARGFFKKGKTDAEKNKAVGGLKNRKACAKCGQLGHWHKDPE